MAFDLPLTADLSAAAAPVTGGVSALNMPTVSPAPIPTSVTPPAPDTGTDVLSGAVASPPPMTPAPGSFGHKLALALDQNPIPLKPNGQPQPGGWARSILGATQQV